MVLVCIAMIVVLMLFGAFTTTKYIIENDDIDDEPDTTTMATTTTTTITNTTYNTTYPPYNETGGPGSGSGSGGSGSYGGIATTQGPPNRTNRIEDVNLRYYNGQTVNTYEDIPLNESKKLLKFEEFSTENATVMFIHGFRENPNQESIHVIVKAYLNAKNATNIILLDWTNMAGGKFLKNAAPNAKLVGEVAAEQLNRLIGLGLDLETFHIVGHSLGSHLAGYIARELKTKYRKTVKRVTALDPVFPGFYPGCKDMQHISADDAEFVDVIHTDAGGFGAPYRTGTADFWPNGGQRIQPGCPKYSRRKLLTVQNLCSHWRSWRYYAESVTDPEAFAASPAPSFKKFKLNRQPEIGMVYMGYTCDSNATGSYFMVTDNRSPFGNGINGLYP